ncbi:unnamed protein product [Rotaria socialis]|uniref:Small ribosomal subunit protein uS14 n=1 Tax=Rotaria socialis TaxID=392032 RepID=A0A817SNT7_9BILA|nr:unnamed protein product [Rotaria socialis]
MKKREINEEFLRYFEIDYLNQSQFTIVRTSFTKLTSTPISLSIYSYIMGHSSIFRSHPHKYGPGSRMCRVCSNGHGIIRKYGLMICRQCFRQYSNDIGFKKLD